MGADTLPPTAPLLAGLEEVRAQIQRHNDQPCGTELARVRDGIILRMRELSDVGGTPLAVDLLLDCDVQLPFEVAREAEQAARVLLQLTRKPTGQGEWHDFHASFCERYGTGTLVPVQDVVHPDTGLGYPATYPNSMPSERDQQLLALAWHAIGDGSGEILLTDDSIATLTGDDRFDPRSIPPHVELAVRIHAPSLAALEAGEFTMTVAPARAAGTLTSRFTPLADGTGLEALYASLPVGTEGALQVQMSFPPVYPHAENICRIPAYLPTLLPLGEHRGDADTTTIVTLDDLAVTATRDRLHLVSLSRRQVIEPQVLHALALEKQPPPLARFLVNLVRGFGARWHEFDWGAHARRLPHLPRLKHGRTVVSPARWQLAASDLPQNTSAADGEWRQALAAWMERWRCPTMVELRDADRTLRLTLEEPAHAAILHAHLARHEEAVFTEAPAADDFGWLAGHAHEIALPLLRSGPPAPSPLVQPLPQIANSRHGHLPGAAETAWLYAKIHTHPERHSEIITEHLPRLLAELGEPAYWFVRYRSRHETDHLRLRLYAPDRATYATYAAAVGNWTQRLREDGIAGRLAFDTYVPETGRYGQGLELTAAERVFAVDSHVVGTTLRHLRASHIHPAALTALNMFDIASAFLGSLPSALDWMISCPAPEAEPANRTVAEQAIAFARRGPLWELPDWPGPVSAALQSRAAALAAYRRQLSADADTGSVLESLLHMHHNRALGIDRDSERTCRRLARQVALARRALEDAL